MYSKFLAGSLLVLSAAMQMPSTAQAQQFSTIAEVLRECPDLDSAIACPSVAGRFISPPNRPGNTEILSLVVNLAEAGQFPRVTMPVCLDTADGIRVLAQGVSNRGSRQQVNDIADSLCLGSRTAAIPQNPPNFLDIPSDHGGWGNGPHDGDISQSSNGGSGNGGSSNGGSSNGGSGNGGNGGNGNGGHGNGGHGNGGHGNGGHGNGGHGNGGHGNGGHGNGGHGNGGHGNGGHDNGGHGNGGHGNGGHGNGGHGNGGHGNGGHDNGGHGNGGHGNGGHGNGGHDNGGRGNGGHDNGGRGNGGRGGMGNTFGAN